MSIVGKLKKTAVKKIKEESKFRKELKAIEKKESRKQARKFAKQKARIKAREKKRQFTKKVKKGKGSPSSLITGVLGEPSRAPRTRAVGKTRRTGKKAVKKARRSAKKPVKSGARKPTPFKDLM